jgi:hypothetical protein
MVLWGSTVRRVEREFRENSMTLAELLLIVVVIILGGLYQKVWYTIRDQRAHQARVERLLAEIRDARQP